MTFFDIHNIAFRFLNYPISYVELFGTIAGLICVYLASVENILTWPIGILNIVCFTAVFFQVQLYADAFLQVYYLITAIYGWVVWRREKQALLEVHRLSKNQSYLLLLGIVLASLLAGLLMAHIHQIWPSHFKQAAAFPYADSFVAVASIVANYLMAKRYIENWVLWIIVDVLCVYLYFSKHINFVAIEYFIFTLIAIKGLRVWRYKLL